MSVYFYTPDDMQMKQEYFLYRLQISDLRLKAAEILGVDKADVILSVDE